MEDTQATQYLEGLLGRNLRIHTTDTRMFIGVFKCTDAVSGHLRATRHRAMHTMAGPRDADKKPLQERNIILANSFEYRMPTTPAVQAAAKATGTWGNSSDGKSTTVKVNMTHRLIGLIVIPGRHITKIELE